RPWSSVTVDRTNPVSVFFSVTVTPGSTPPVASVTTPARSNRVTSARTFAGSDNTHSNAAMRRRDARRDMASDYRSRRAQNQALGRRRTRGRSPPPASQCAGLPALLLLECGALLVAGAQRLIVLDSWSVPDDSQPVLESFVEYGQVANQRVIFL